MNFTDWLEFLQVLYLFKSVLIILNDNVTFIFIGICLKIPDKVLIVFEVVM